MKLGTTIPFGEPEQVVELAKLAEQLGLDSVSRLDMITSSPGGSDRPPQDLYESLVSLAYIAAVTERIRLLVNVIILPLREPVILAKQLATLDRFSGGRLLFGLGLGASRADFESVRAGEAKFNRGKILDETLEALSLLLTHDNVNFKGEFIHLEGVSLRPRPLQDPFPIYIAGNAPATLDRVARSSRGWIHSTLTAKEPFPQRLTALKRLLEARNRDMSEIDVTVVLVQSIGRTHEEAVERLRSSSLASHSGAADWDSFLSENLVGTPEEVADRIDDYRKLGAKHCIGLHFAADTFEELREQIQIFGEEVVPAFKLS